MGNPWHFIGRPFQMGVWLVAGLCLMAADCNTDEVDRMVSLRFDPSVSPGLRDTIKRDIRSMANFNFNISSHDPFRQVFGPDGSKSVVRYLDERINYVIGPDPSISQFVSSTRSNDGRIGAIPVRSRAAPANYAEEEGEAALKAQNIGLELWLLQEAAGPASMSFTLDGSTIPISSPRIGLFRIYQGYLQDFFIENISILIHEARHSDCSGGLDQALIEAIRDGDMNTPSRCGHRHSVCPAGHVYADLPACDAFAWGAYSVQALWLSHVANHCQNCRSRDQILARAMLADAISRVPNFEQMIQGRQGPPDMTSAGTPLDRIRGALQDFRSRRERQVPLR